MGVTVPAFHAIGILLVLIDKLNKKVICSASALNAAIYSLVLILGQPDGLVILSSEMRPRTELTEIFGSRCSDRTCGRKVPGSRDGGINDAKLGPTFVKKLLIKLGESLGSHRVSDERSLTPLIELSLHSGIISLTLDQNLFGSDLFCSIWLI